MRSARLLLPLALLAAGCGGGDDPTERKNWIMPEMVDSVPYDAFAQNPVLKNGQTLQPPPAGTIARGKMPFDYGTGDAEAQRAGRELANPLPATPANVERGDKVFHIICFTCHGAGGKGDGPIIPRFPQPPSLLAARAKGLPDGQLFHIITRGQNLMPSHAAQVLPEDRWKVIHYIRTLQKAAGGTP